MKSGHVVVKNLLQHPNGCIISLSIRSRYVGVYYATFTAKGKMGELRPIVKSEFDGQK